MAECTVASDSIPQLPLVVLTKVVLMLPRSEDEGWVFKDPLQLAAVSRQLRQAVLSSIQQRKRRHMWIDILKDHISVSGITVKNEVRSCYSVTRRLLSCTQQMIQRMMPTRVNHNSNMELRSAYSQMDCVDALLAFAQPNLLYLLLKELTEKLLSPGLILMRSLPLSLTSLNLVLLVNEIGVDSPLDQILKAVGSKTNLETLKINVECYNDSVAATHKKSSPSVPKDSPFNHLLTLRNLRAFHIHYDSNGLLSPAQMADLVNRSQSKITHICCQNYVTQKMDELFKALSDVVRGNITNICCVYLGFLLHADVLQFLDRLPNCATIHFTYGRYVSRQEFDELGDRLLDVCCADDVHPGRTLECSVGGFSDLQEYVDEGGETQMEYARGDTVVRLIIGSYPMMKLKHCPFSINPDDCL